MVQAFNIGRDARLDIVLANGTPLRPSILTEFSCKQETVDLKSRPLNDRPIHQIIYDGWTFTATFDRADSVIDDYFCQAEDNYYAGQNATEIYITQTIKDANTGVLSQYRLTGVVMKYDDAGTYKSEDKVPVKVSGMATARRKVS